MTIRSLIQAIIFSTLWWYGRWLVSPAVELSLSQSLMIAGITIIICVAYATFILNLTARLSDRWSAGALEGKSAEAAKLTLSFASLLLLGALLLLLLVSPALGLASVFSVSLVLSVLRATVNERLTTT